jgi:hypothetical protein
MATSFVEFKNYGYWSNDGFLEGVLYLLNRELKKIEPSQDWMNNVIEEWTFAYSVGFSGCIPVCLNEYFNSEDKVSILRQVLEKLIRNFDEVDNYITVQELNDNRVGGDGRWIGINQVGFINTAELMLDLINGKLKTDASSPIDYLKY